MNDRTTIAARKPLTYEQSNRLAYIKHIRATERRVWQLLSTAELRRISDTIEAAVDKDDAAHGRKYKRWP